MRSFADYGHRYVLYTYRRDLRVPTGVECRDAAPLIAPELYFTYGPGDGAGSHALFSNLFGYKLLAEQGGWWVDTDVVCFGREIPQCEIFCAYQEFGIDQRRRASPVQGPSHRVRGMRRGNRPSLPERNGHRSATRNAASDQVITGRGWWWDVGCDRVQRIWRRERLYPRNKGREAGSRSTMAPASGYGRSGAIMCGATTL